MLKAIAMSSSILVFSAIGSTAEVNTAFSKADMLQQEKNYELMIDTSSVVSASVIELQLAVSGLGDLRTADDSVCTQWQGADCSGSYENIFSSELLYEVSISINCDDELLYKERKNYSEFTNEQLSTADSSLSFDISLFKLSSVECQSVRVNIATLGSGETDMIRGSFRLGNSTSGTGSLNYEVIQ